MPPMTLEADAGGMGVESETPHQYAIKVCCHETDCSRGTV